MRGNAGVHEFCEPGTGVMSEIRDRIANLNVQVRSADGTVDGRLSMREGMSIEFAKDVRDRHDEESLSRSVEEVLRGMAVGKRRAGELILRQARENQSSLPEPGPLERHREAVDKDLAKLDISVESPRDHMMIRQVGQETFFVILRPGTLRRLDHDELAREVTAAARKITRIFAAHARNTTTRVYDHARSDPQRTPA